MKYSLIPAFPLENQLAGKEPTLRKLHRFDVHEARGIDHTHGDKHEILEVPGEQALYRQQRMDAQTRVPADQQHRRRGGRIERRQ